MSCQETQQALSLYVDDELALPVRAACDEHLRECPLCRAELAEMRAVSREPAALARQPNLPLSVRLTRWLRPRLMPYTVGSFASVLLFTVMFSALRPHM